MTSIIKVDTLQKANGGTPTAADLGINTTGNVIQVVTYTDTSVSNFITSSSGYVTSDSLPRATITPKFSNSKVLIQAMVGMQNDQTGQIENTIYRTTGGTATDLSGNNTYGLAFKGVNTGTFWAECSITWADSPNTTNSVEYKWYSRSEHGNNVTPCHQGTSISMTLMEIAQ
jgi:hypothetical protein